jgi:NAD(P)H dehydrogenase (quinone)
MASDVFGVSIDYVRVSVKRRYEMFDAMGVPRKFTEGMDGHPDAHLWCSEEMVTADIAFQTGLPRHLTHHIEYITGQKPAPMRTVFDQCKGRDTMTAAALLKALVSQSARRGSHLAGSTQG